MFYSEYGSAAAAAQTAAPLLSLVMNFRAVLMTVSGSSPGSQVFDDGACFV